MLEFSRRGPPARASDHTTRLDGRRPRSWRRLKVTLRHPVPRETTQATLPREEVLSGMPNAGRDTPPPPCGTSASGLSHGSSRSLTFDSADPCRPSPQNRRSHSAYSPSPSKQPPTVHRAAPRRAAPAPRAHVHAGSLVPLRRRQPARTGARATRSRCMRAAWRTPPPSRAAPAYPATIPRRERASAPEPCSSATAGSLLTREFARPGVAARAPPGVPRHHPAPPAVPRHHPAPPRRTPPILRAAS